MLSDMDEARPVAPDGAEFDTDQNVGKLIVSGGIWRLIAFAFAAALGVLATAIISRSVGPADFALFTTAMSLVTIALSLSDIGLLSLGLREFAALKGAERERSQRALITIRMILSVFSAIGIVVFAVLKGYPDYLVVGLVAAGLGLCLFSLQVSYTVPIQATFRLNTVAALEAGRQSLLLLLMIAAVLVTSNVGWLIAAYLPTGIVLVIATVIPASRISSIVPSWDPLAMRQLVSRVGTFAVAATIGGIYAYVAQILCNSILTPHASGMFSLAFRVFAVMLGACMTAASGAFPLFVTAAREGDFERLAYATRRVTQTALLAGAVCTVGMLSGADFIVDVLGGAEFADAAPVVAVISLALPGSFLLIVWSMFLLATDHHRALVVSAVVGASVSVGITAILAMEFGAVGAAAGVAVGEYAIAFGYLSKLVRVDRRALPQPGWALAAVLAAAAACLVVLLPLSSLLMAIVGMLAFALLVLALGLLPPELIHPLRGLLRSVRTRD